MANKDNKSVDSLLEKLKESIPDIKDFNYTINLNIYDATLSTTWILSDVIKYDGTNLYADNTYTITYDPTHSLSLEDYSNTYYVTSFDDLVTVISFIKDHQDLYTSTTWCYDELISKEELDNLTYTTKNTEE